MKIKNTAQVGTTDLRKDALAIAEAGLNAIDTQTVIRRSISKEDNTITLTGTVFVRDDIDRLYVIGIGKCSLDACTELEEILGDTISAGITVDVRCNPNLKYIKSCEGTHPMPSDQNINYTKEIITLLEGCTARDVVLVIVSGGGSTLLCQPHNHTCEQEVDIIRAFFDAGATIQEINTIRKHISLARGGYLAKHAFPARVISLIFSDVPGDDTQFIASGPTVKDTTTREDATRIAEKYDIVSKSGFSLEHLIETPKDDIYFEKVINTIVVSNQTALVSMAKVAQSRGYNTEICDNCLTGEARVVGHNIAVALHNESGRKALLYGGETTVTITGKGRGGRNQEVALGALKEIGENELVLSLASDGRDNSECAGAFADATMKKYALELGLGSDSFLNENNSFEFFEKTHGHIHTQSTGSNVSDLVIALKG